VSYPLIFDPIGQIGWVGDLRENYMRFLSACILLMWQCCAPKTPERLVQVRIRSLRTIHKSIYSLTFQTQPYFNQKQVKEKGKTKQKKKSVWYWAVCNIFQVKLKNVILSKQESS